MKTAVSFTFVNPNGYVVSRDEIAASHPAAGLVKRMADAMTKATWDQMFDNAITRTWIDGHGNVHIDPIDPRDFLAG